MIGLLLLPSEKKPNAFNSNILLKPLPLKQIFFETNGVLKAKWIKNYLNLNKKTNLRTLNLSSLKKRLHRLGQIRSLQITSIFPNSLRISIKEYKPFLYTQGRINQRIQKILISTEGIPFIGINHDNSFIKKLPLLTGFSLKYTNKKFQPIQQISIIKNFLEINRRISPNLAWRKINIKDLKKNPNAPGSRIHAVSNHPYAIIFNSKAISKQAHQLKKILFYLETHPSKRPIQLINLTFKDPVVQLK